MNALQMALAQLDELSVVGHAEADKRLREVLRRYHEQLRGLSLRLALVEEKQRREIAAGLHDHVGHSLALARIALDGVVDRLGAEERESVQEALAHLRNALDATRQLTFDLGSADLVEFGLDGALETLGERVTSRASVDFRFSAMPVGDVPETVTIVLYRCVRELLMNAVKHAGARVVRVQLRRSDDRIEVEVADDGRGLSAEVLRRPGSQGGFGLASVRREIEAMGGDLAVEASPCRGACLRVRVPVASVPSE